MDYMDNELWSSMSLDDILLLEDVEDNIKDDIEFWGVMLWLAKRAWKSLNIKMIII